MIKNYPNVGVIKEAESREQRQTRGGVGERCAEARVKTLAHPEDWRPPTPNGRRISLEVRSTHYGAELEKWVTSQGTKGLEKLCVKWAEGSHLKV